MRDLKTWPFVWMACALFVLSGCVATASAHYPEAYVIERHIDSSSYHPPHAETASHHGHHSTARCDKNARALHYLPLAYRSKEALRYALTQLEGRRLKKLRMTYQTNNAKRWDDLSHRALHVDVDLITRPKMQGTECVPDKRLLSSLFAFTPKSRLGLMHFDQDVTQRDWSTHKSLFFAAEKSLFRTNFCSYTKACFESATYRFSFGRHQSIELVVDSMSTFKMRFVGFAGLPSSRQLTFWKSDFKAPKRMSRYFKPSFDRHQSREVHRHTHQTHLSIGHPGLGVHIDLRDTHPAK